VTFFSNMFVSGGISHNKSRGRMIQGREGGKRIESDGRMCGRRGRGGTEENIAN
jgi:hypothetical protein